MIKLRLNALSGVEEQIEFKHGEKIDQLIRRSLEMSGHDVDTFSIEEHFTVVLNGFIVEPDIWSVVEVARDAHVLIAPKIQGGDFGQTFKQLAIIAITIAAYQFSPFGAVGTALFVAGASVGGTLLLNDLIPPPDYGAGSIPELEEPSQMYTISSQSNAVRKFNKVPKVYGTHRIFPPLAANSYTELEASSGGSLDQYFYAIYDMGIGPMVVDTIRIGNTRIENYDDVTWNLVDLNKGDSGGIWDTQCNSNFRLYKGDITSEQLSIGLNKNKQDVPAPAKEEYSATRTTGTNPDKLPSEITVSFAFPQGLVAYGSDGSAKPRRVEYDVEFRKAGTTEPFKPFNSPDHVSHFNIVSTDNATRANENTILFEIYVGNDVSDSVEELYTRGTYSGGEYTLKTYYGMPAGTTVFYGTTSHNAAPGNQPLRVGDTLILGDHIAAVTKVDYAFTNAGLFDVYRYEFDNPLPTTYELYSNEDIGGSGLIVTVPFKYTGPSGTVYVDLDDPNPVYLDVKFIPKVAGVFEVRVTRVRSTSSVSYRIQDAMTWYKLQTRLDKPPIKTAQRHTFLELKIRATNQLSGTIQNLSAEVSSVLDVYDAGSGTWVKQITNNPAWVFADILTGDAITKAIPKSRLDVDSLVAWAAHCDEVPPISPPGTTYTYPRFQSNFVLDFNTSKKELLKSVAGAADASLNIVDGKYGVLLDIKKDIPVQVFTNRNSSNFNSTRNYIDTPHGLKIKYVDAASSWQLNEVPVYFDGYDETTATAFEEMSSFGCTNPEQAFRLGRRHVFASTLRQENITIDVDFEGLVCTRGDYVKFAQDVMKVGGTPARVKAISGSEVKIDSKIETTAGVDYGYTVRSVALGIPTSTLTVVDAETFIVDGPVPSIGDLIIIGEVGKISIDCLVKAITPRDDLTATLTLVEKADQIYDSEFSSEYPTYSPLLNENRDADLYAPSEVQNLIVTDNTYRVLGKDYQYYIEIDWDNPQYGAVDVYEIYVDSGTGYRLEAVINDSVYEYIVNQKNLGVEHSFKVLAVSATGKKLNLAEIGSVEATPYAKTSPPSNVDGLNIDITNEVLQLSWNLVDDLDVSEYFVRYTPVTTSSAVWESSVPLDRADANTSTMSVQARTGTYFIKAVDFNGNESALAAQALTTIPELFNLNVVAELDDAPTWDGQKNTVEKLSDNTLVLRTKTVGGADTNEFHSEGYYDYSSFLDLGEIYTVRLQSSIVAEGYTVGDLMENWTTLADVEFLSEARYSEWSVEAQYRTTDSYNVISDWATLDSILALDEGAPEVWTEWRPFTITDATGRIFQFRLVLKSYKASVTPRVIVGTIKADMPDRVQNIKDIISSATVPTTVTYSPAFAGPGTSPTIQITQDSMQRGDYFVLSNKTLDGFQITFYDINDAQVSRKFDVAASGWGRRALKVI